MRLWVTIVLILAVLSIWQYRQMRNRGESIRNIDQVLVRTRDLAATQMQYELAVKNFLLTTDSAYMKVAVDSARTLPNKLADLRLLLRQGPHGLTPDSPAARMVDSLEVLLGDEVQIPAFSVLRGGGDGRPGERIIAQAGTGGETHTWPGRSVEIQALTGRILAGQQKRRAELRHGNQIRASELQATLWALIAAVVGLGILLLRSLRSRQEADLRQSEDRYKMLFEKSPLPKWIYDEETLRFVEVNEAAVRMYGYSEDEFRQITLADIRPAEDVGRLMDDIRDVRNDPRTYHAAHWRHIRKNGEMIDVEVTAHPLILDGRRARMVAIVDITERKRQERQLQQLNADLAARAADLSASNAELERYAYIASHDLQEPLRMVSSFLQLLEKRYKGRLDAKADQYIHYAVDGVERMKALIMDLLEYSRVGTGMEGFGWVDIDEVMAEATDVFRESIVASRAHLDIGELPQVWGDKVQLTQLMQNLIGNALKYSGGRPPVIRVSGNEQPAYWQFAIADNGIGIDPQFFDRIFIIFQRLHNKSVYSGTGIGLAICKKIVERHGGRIWVESGSGQGSTFYFTIGKPK